MSYGDWAAASNSFEEVTVKPPFELDEEGVPLCPRCGSEMKGTIVKYCISTPVWWDEDQEMWAWDEDDANSSEEDIESLSCTNCDYSTSDLHHHPDEEDAEAYHEDVENRYLNVSGVV